MAWQDGMAWHKTIVEKGMAMRQRTIDSSFS